MLGQSNLLLKLRKLMPADGSLGPLYSLFGDPAYLQSLHLFGGFRNVAAGSLEALWNTMMLQVRQVVKWGFKEVICQWTFLDNRPRRHEADAKPSSQQITTTTNNNQPEEQWYNKYQKPRSHGSTVYTWSVSLAKKKR
jgi:hypothetical protein